MSQMQEVPTETRTSKKVVVAVVVAFLVLAGLLFSLSKYYRLAGKVGERVSHQMLEGQAVDLVKLENDYKENLKELLGSYLLVASETADLAGEDFLLQTQNIGVKIIDLTVPASFKEHHLKVVLALAQIEEKIVEDEVSNIDTAFEELRQAMSNL